MRGNDRAAIDVIKNNQMSSSDPTRISDAVVLAATTGLTVDSASCEERESDESRSRRLQVAVLAVGIVIHSLDKHSPFKIFYRVR